MIIPADRGGRPHCGGGYPNLSGRLSLDSEVRARFCPQVATVPPTPERSMVDVNFEERSFQMRLDSETMISGTYDDAISRERPAPVPSRYRAEVRISTRILPQQTEEPVSYFLISLDPDG